MSLDQGVGYFGLVLFLVMLFHALRPTMKGLQFRIQDLGFRFDMARGFRRGCRAKDLKVGALQDTTDMIWEDSKKEPLKSGCQ